MVGWEVDRASGIEVDRVVQENSNLVDLDWSMASSFDQRADARGDRGDDGDLPFEILFKMFIR